MMDRMMEGMGGMMWAAGLLWLLLNRPGPRGGGTDQILAI
jgi:hypothetical protein